MEIFPCRYLTVNHVTRREPTPPSEPLLTPLAPLWFLACSLAAGAVLALAGCVISVLGWPHPSFTLARLLAILSATAIVAAAGTFALALNVHTGFKAVLIVLGVSNAGWLLLASMLWLNQREADSLRAVSHDGQSARTTQNPTLAQAPTSATEAPAASVSTTTESGLVEIDATAGSKEHPLAMEDARRLAKMFASHTDVEARALAKRYIGRWMRVEGQVFNVRQSSDPSHTVYAVSVTEDYKGGEHLLMYLLFDDKVEPSAKFLHHGDKIAAKGRMYDLDRDGPDLKDCELLLSP